MEKDTRELATVMGMEPSDVMKKDYFVCSFGKSDIKWFEEYDNNGNNDVDQMRCKDIVKRMNARMFSRVSKSKQELGSRRGDHKGNDSKRGNGGQGDGNQESSRKRQK